MGLWQTLILTKANYITTFAVFPPVVIKNGANSYEERN